jgi:hypothetical protein
MFELFLLVAVAFFLAGRASVQKEGTLEQSRRIRMLIRENGRLARRVFRE